MTYHSQLNLIMLVTVVCLGIFLYLKPQFQFGADDEYRISIRTPETVQSIRFLRHDRETVLRRVAGIWRLVEPLSARADEAVVGKMLNVLSANSRQRFPLRDVESFGLDHPNLALYIDDDYFAFGGIAPVTNEQYLAINEEVYLVSPRYAIWMPVDLTDMISRKLLGDNEIPVQFDIGDLSVQHQAGDWRVVSQSGGRPTDEMLARWVNKWRYNQAAELLLDSHDEPEDQAIIIRLLDDNEIVLKAVNTDSGTVFYRAGERVGYFFPVQSARHLLNPFIVESE